MCGCLGDDDGGGVGWTCLGSVDGAERGIVN